MNSLAGYFNDGGLGFDQGGGNVQSRKEKQGLLPITLLMAYNCAEKAKEVHGKDMNFPIVGNASFIGPR